MLRSLTCNRISAVSPPFFAPYIRRARTAEGTLRPATGPERLHPPGMLAERLMLIVPLLLHIIWLGLSVAAGLLLGLHFLPLHTHSTGANFA